MILNSSANVKNGSTLVTYTGGDPWEPVVRPAYMRVAGFADLFMIAEVDPNSTWLQLCRPYTRPTQTNVAVQIVMDFTPELNLPVGNPGDVDMADLYNRAMLLLDRAPQFVPLHGPTHVGLGLDPVPLASTTDSGLLGKLSGVATDYVGGDNSCHALSGVPTGIMLGFGGPVSAVPAGWLPCDGRVLYIAAYPNLHGVIGTSWGGGTDNGLTTFNIPDIRGYAMVGAGAGPGRWNWGLGVKSGSETHVLTQNELAWHGHPFSQNQHTHPITDKQHAHTTVIPCAWEATWSGGSSAFHAGYYQSTAYDSDYRYTGINVTNGDYAQIGIGGTGGNYGHLNVQPSVGVNVIIKT